MEQGLFRGPTNLGKAPMHEAFFLYSLHGCVSVAESILQQDV